VAGLGPGKESQVPTGEDGEFALRDGLSLAEYGKALPIRRIEARSPMKRVTRLSLLKQEQFMLGLTLRMLCTRYFVKKNGIYGSDIWCLGGSR
jgi:hypothetical protein